VTAVVIAIVVIIVLAVALLLGRRTKRQSGIDRSEEIRTQAAEDAAVAVPPAQERAAEAEADAERARAEAEAAERRAAEAEAQAQQARLEAQQAEAAHEDQVREADRLDPRVDQQADGYEPQLPGTTDQQPAPPPAADEVATEPTSEPDAVRSPLLPRRTPGAQEMPGKPIEQTDAGGGWFTKPAPSQPADPDES
jgi:FtsZ-interacting cell division protein ZipA